MNLEISKLIANGTNERVTAVQLNALLLHCSDIDLIRYHNNKTMFHLLVSHKKYNVLDILLSDETYNKTAQMADKRGKTILHYAAEGDCARTLDVVLRHLPGLINIVDLEGNAPIHLALMNRYIPAIKAIVKTGQVHQIKNNAGMTPEDLAAQDPALISALIYIDLTRVNSVNFKRRSTDSQLSVTLCEAFPLLASSRRDGNLDISWPDTPGLSDRPTPTSSSSTSLSESLNSDRTGSEQTARCSSSVELPTVINETDINERYLHDLLAQILSETKPGGVLKESLIVSFAQMSAQIAINASDESLRRLVCSHGSNYLILEKMIERLHCFAVEHYTQYDKNLEELTWEFEALLKSKVRDEVYLSPDVTVIDNETPLLTDKLWSMVTGKEVTHNDTDVPALSFHFDKKQATYRVVGQNIIYTSSQIIRSLRLLFPYLTIQQRLNANYLVWQMIVHDPDALFSSSIQMNRFKEINRDEREGLGLIGNVLNEKFSTLSDLIGHIRTIELNLQCLKKWYQAPEFMSGKIQLDEWIDRAMAKKPGRRDMELRIIAREMLGVMIEFYRELNLRELGKGEWSKPDAAVKTPHIVNITSYINKMIDYLSRKILNCPREKRADAVRFILELAKHFCTIDPTKVHDLTTLKLLDLVLNTGHISRLTETFKELTTEEKEFLAQVHQLAGDENNALWMKRLFDSNPNALPFLAKCQMHLVSVIEVNKPIYRAEMQGKIIAPIIAVKNRVRFILVLPQTNIHAFIKDYVPLGTDDLYNLSVRVFPRKADVLKLTGASQTPLDILKTLNEEYLASALIPTFNYKNKNYPPKKEVSSILKKWFAAHLQIAIQSSPDCLPELINEMNRAFKELNRVGVLYDKPFNSDIRDCRYYVAFPCFAELAENPLKLLETLNKHYFQDDIIPSFVYRKKHYSGDKIRSLLIKWFNNIFDLAISKEPTLIEPLIIEFDRALSHFNRIVKKSDQNLKMLDRQSEIKKLVERAALKGVKLKTYDPSRACRFFAPVDPRCAATSTEKKAGSSSSLSFSSLGTRER